MELDYFISLSDRASSSVKDKWLDSSSAASRSFAAKTSYSVTGISGDSDFSLFFTLHKRNINPANIISNYSSSGGFGICFNHTNKLFALSHYPDVDGYNFSNINLSQKNCLGIIKNDRNITILNYDIDAKQIYQRESFSFNNDTSISGSGFVIGYSSPFYSKTSITGVSGLFDQLVLFNTALSDVDALTVFSGFLPLTKSSSTVYGSPYFDDYNFTLNEGSSLTLTGALNSIPFLNYLSTGVVPMGTGNYMARISGLIRYNYNDILWSGYYVSGDGIKCTYTGVPTVVTGTYTGNVALTNEYITFVNQIYASTNENSERVVSHLFSFTTYMYPDLDDYFSYNKISKYRTETTTTLTTSSDSYKSGFYMSGIILDKKYCYLMKYRDKTFEDVGIELPFDTAKQRFIATDEMVLGYNLYWGYNKISTYDISGIYIETSVVDETKDFSMIFDKSVYDPTYQSANFSFATGVFPRGAAIALGGESVYANTFRESKKNFIETSPYDLLHSKKNKALSVNFEDLFLNNDQNWSGTMPTFTI